MTATTRFAPSPTGYLHRGHAYSALFAAEQAGDEGRFLLRIEDIDPVRCRPEYTDAIKEDLAWLGLAWPEPARVQSAHLDDYTNALDRLDAMGLLYPCFCTRGNIRREIEAAGYAPHEAPNGPDGPIYPGICRGMDNAERADRIARGDVFAQRLNITKAVRMAGALTWHDRDQGIVDATPEIFGDVVLARKDVPTSYHLSVTVDDHLQGVTLVTRGEDLFPASHLHRLLQALLGLDVPEWRHHTLLTDDEGRRYAKRDFAATLRDLRQQGEDSGALRRGLGFS